MINYQKTGSLVEEIVGSSQKDNNQVKNRPETVIDLDEYEANKFLNSSQANLLDKTQKSEEIELGKIQTEQTAQILQKEPFGMPSSSKPK